MRVTVDRELCDANGVCTSEAPTVFGLTGDDELVLLREEVGPGEADQVRSAALLCPKRAIHLVG